MHTYLESVGFDGVRTRKEMDSLIGFTVLHFDEKHLFTDDRGRRMGEFSKSYGPGVGLTVCGEFDEDGSFHPDYTVPYFRGEAVSSSEELTFERHAARESYAGAFDDPRVGVTIIFYLSNMGEFKELQNSRDFRRRPGPVKLNLLAREASVILPVLDNYSADEEYQRKAQEHIRLISKARFGDQEAIESLTMEDMDLYTEITDRLQREDILSIVESTFMPCGVECDQYNIIGNIISCEEGHNSFTGETIYRMEIEICDMRMNLCVAGRSLFGEPKAGRRIKAQAWLTGWVSFARDELTGQ